MPGLMEQVYAAAKDGTLATPFTSDDVIKLVATFGRSYPDQYVRAALRRATKPSHCQSTVVYFDESTKGYTAKDTPIQRGDRP